MHAPYTLTYKYLIIGFYGHYSLQLHYKLITSLELGLQSLQVNHKPQRV
jgi:hypothetical protein